MRFLELEDPQSCLQKATARLYRKATKYGMRVVVVLRAYGEKNARKELWAQQLPVRTPNGDSFSTVNNDGA